MNENKNSAPSGGIIESIASNADAMIILTQGYPKQAVISVVDAWVQRQLARRATAGTTAAPSDERIVAALHACGIDTRPSKYGFDALQVDATSVPNLRNVFANLYLATAGNAAPTEALQQVLAWADRANPASYGGLPANIRAVVESALATPAAPENPISMAVSLYTIELEQRVAELEKQLAATAAPGDLPRLPQCKMLVGTHLDSLHTLYSAERAREIQREAYNAGFASQLPRIRHLERERDIARACIASNAGAAIPEGFKLLSRTPTDEMCIAAREKIGTGSNVADHVFRAMWDAAPSNSPKGG